MFSLELRCRIFTATKPLKVVFSLSRRSQLFSKVFFDIIISCVCISLFSLHVCEECFDTVTSSVTKARPKEIGGINTRLNNSKLYWCCVNLIDI